MADVRILLVAAVGLGALLWVKSAGGITKAAEQAGAAAVDAAGGIVRGAVGEVGAAVGVPRPDDTTTDAREARWIIDNRGMWQASLWSGAPALFQAVRMAAGTGRPPSPTSAAGVALGVPALGLGAGDFARMDRAAYADSAAAWAPAPGYAQGLPEWVEPII